MSTGEIPIAANLKTALAAPMLKEIERIAFEYKLRACPSPSRLPDGGCE
jgi:hypothetical protein